MESVRLASLAYELAATPVGDAELAEVLGLGRETVASLSLGRKRTFAPDGVGPSELAASAARKALADAGLDAAGVDFVIFSTNTPDYTFPGSACLLQAALGCATVGCLDIRAVCSGFVVALDLARRYVGSGTYGRVLVAAAEVPSHQNRFDGTDPELACLTGDAGTAAVVVAGEDPIAVLACRARVDGRRHRMLWCEFPASRHLGEPGVVRGERLTRAAVEEGKIYPIADFEALREAALQETPHLVDEVLAECGLARADAAIVAHVDPRTQRQLEERLLGRVDRIVPSDLIYCYSATLPAVLARAMAAGDITSGETVALVSAGGGASWGVCVIRT